MEPIIRNGRPEDVPAVLHLIRQLAEYERAPLEVENSEEEFSRDAFGPDPVCGFYVAEAEGKVVGAAIYYVKYSTWKGRCLFLEDIIVDESWRGRKIGRMLFNAVAMLAREKKYRRLEWQVLDWNEPAIRFYKKYDAVLDPEWVNGKLVYDQLQKFEPLV
ncbi:MAG: hypothetical protein RL220_396 [Bacteroidota bacterium]